MRFLITIEVREGEGDSLPDIETVETDYESLEEAWRLSRAVAAAQQTEHPGCHITVVDVNPIVERPACANWREHLLIPF